MSDCPNCNTTEMPESYPVRVDSKTLVEDKALQFSNIKGVESVQKLGNEKIEIHINQSAYESHNHFKNRDKFSNMSHVNIEDVKNSVVHLEFDTNRLPNIVTAFRCLKCDHVWDPELGDLNHANPLI